MKLLDPQGNAVSINGNSPDNQVGPFTLVEGGTYTLRFQGSGAATGKYSFRLLDVAAQPTLAFNTTASGTLQAGAADLYQFAGSAGERVFLEWQASSNAGNYTVYGPSGQSVGNTTFSYPLDLTLPGNGTYIIVLPNTTGNPLTYNFQLTTPPVNTALLKLTDPTAITSSSLTTAGQIDNYLFTGSAGQRLYFDGLTGPAGNGGVSGGTISAVLLNPDGSQNTINTQITNDAGPYTLLQSGTYTLRVTGTYQTIGAYSFRLIDLATVPDLAIGSPLTGDLNPGPSTDLYRITATAGQRLHVTWQQGSGANAAYYVYGPNDQYITSGSFGNAFDIYFPAVGDYYLAFQGRSQDTTPYGITATDTSDTPVSASGFGAQAGSVKASSTTTFTFTAPAGRVAYFNGQSTNSNVGYTITDPNTNYVTKGGTYYNNGPFRLNTSGTYTITLTNYASSDQTFTYQLLDLGDPTLTALTLGSEVTSANLTADGVDVYTFTGSAGQELYFDSFLTNSSSGTNASWSLIDGDNLQSVVTGNAHGDTGPFSLPESGTYYFIITNTSSTATSYDFRLLDAAAQKTLTLNTTVNDPLNPGTSTNLYTFTGQAGQRLFLSWSGASLSDVNYQLYGPTNQSVNGSYYYYNTVSNPADFTLPSNGTYTFVVSGNHATNTSYAFDLTTATTNTFALTLGATVNGDLTMGGQIDSYTFTGTVGQTLYFDGLSADNSSIALTLTAPGGNTVSPRHYDVASDGQPVTLTEAGTYTLQIAASTAGATGNYGFRLLDRTAQPAVTLGNTVSGTLDPGTSTELYQITGSAGQRLFVDWAGASGYNYNGQYTLYDPNNQSLGTNYFGSPLDVTLAAAGTYTLALVGNSATQPVSYSFTVTTPASRNGTLTLGKTVVASSMAAGQTDTYTFTGSPGQMIYYDGLTGSSSVSAKLTGPTGNDLFEPAVTSDASPTVLTVAGTYTLSISNPGSATSGYSFRLLDAGAQPTLPLNQPQTGLLSQGTSTAIYQFSGTAGQRTYIRWLNGTGGDYTLYSPTLQYVSSNSFGYDLQTTLPVTGTYTLILAGSASASIPYGLEVLTPATNTYSLALNTTTSGIISAYGQNDAYTVTGSAGQRLYLNGLNSPNFSATLVSPSGATPLNSIDLGSDSSPITLTEAGTYTLTVRPGIGVLGAYSFRLDDLTATPEILQGATFTVTLPTAPTTATTVAYATADGTAIANTDYIARTGSLVFNPGETTRTVKVYTLPDLTATGSRTFDLNLSFPATPTQTAAQGVGTITFPTATAASLQFGQQPASATAGFSLGSAITVQLLDQYGNPLNTSGVAVTLSVGQNPGASVLSGTRTVNTVNGVATFGGLSLNYAGIGYSLVADATGLGEATSARFDISAGAAAGFVFAQQPDVTLAGQVISPAVVVDVVDANGNLVTTATNTVTLALVGGPGSLGGTLQVKAINGVATFNNLTVSVRGTGYTLTAEATGLNTATSAAFDISAVDVAVQFSQQPVSTPAGITLAPVLVQVVDDSGNLVPSSKAQITLALGNNPTNANLHGTLTETVVNGVATFSDLSIDQVEAGLVLTATATGLTSATSNTFDSTAAIPASLQIAQGLTDTTAGTTLAVVKVQILDSLGNPSSAALNVSLALLGAPNGAKLFGTTTVKAVGGVATFSDLSITQAGTDFELQASGAALGTTDSNTFNIAAAQAYGLSFAQQPTTTPTGDAMAPAVAVQVVDAYGNPIGTGTEAVTLALNAGINTGQLAGTLTENAVNGTATFSDLNISARGDGYSLTATAAGLGQTTSHTFSVTPASPRSVSIEQQPGNVMAGQAFAPAVTVDVLDRFGQIVVNSTVAVTLALGPGSGTAGLNGTTTVNAVAGVVTFTGVSVNQAGTYTLVPSSTGLTATASNLFTVAAVNAPDLQVTGLTVSPATNLQSGADIVLQWQGSNTGDQPTTGPWYDYVTVTNETTGKTLLTEAIPYDAATRGAIAAGSSQAQQYAFKLNDGPDGTGKIDFTVTTDYFNQIAELNGSGTGETNNTTTFEETSTQALYPTLTVSNVTAPALTIGDPATVTIGWKVTNNGTGPGTVASWVDEIIASPSTDPSGETVLLTVPHTGVLQPGASYTESQTFLLPPAFEGSYHLFVVTDAKNVVFENDNKSGRAAEAGNLFDVTPKPYADLVISSVTPPTLASSGQPFPLSFTVTNQGIGTTDTLAWNDSVSLASDAAGKNIVANLGSFQHLGNLAVGGSYVHNVAPTLPDGISGTYYLVVSTGGPYEFIYTNNDTTVSGPFTVTLTPAPSLDVTDVTGPTAASSGDRVDVSWTVRNDGPGDANGSWFDDVQLVEVGGQKTTYDLGQFEFDGTVTAGKFYQRTETVQIPADLQGQYQFVVTTNSGNILFENGATSHHTRASDSNITTTLAPNPDLQIQSATVPATAQAGGTLGVSWTVINRGSVPTSTPHWNDDVYLSYTQTLGGDAVLLASVPNPSALDAGEEYLSQATGLLIPDRFAGPAYIVIVANSGQTVDTYPNTTDNTWVVPITINPLPPADLVLSDVQIPAQVFSGTSIQVTYTVTNDGSGPTDVPDWTDTLWLATDKREPNPSKGDVELGSFSHAGVLAVGDSYTTTVTVQLPDHLSGNYFITPWTDPYNQVLKNTLDVNVNPDDPNELNNDNYKAAALTLLLTPPPDLIVTSVQPTATAVGGEPFDFSWTVKNQGTSPTEDSVLFDQVYLSSAPTLNAPGAAQWFLGTYEYDGVVTAGGTYTQSEEVVLSPEASGRYVIVVANTGFEDTPPTWEGPYTDNNTRSAPTFVTPRPPGDLQVTNVTTLPQNFSGEKTTVTWTVTNEGADIWAGTQYWQDDVYFSPDPTLILSRATLIGTYIHGNDQPLANGQSYTVSQDFTLPAGIGGTYYIYVITNPHGADNLGPGDNDGSRDYYVGNAYEDPTNNQGSTSIPVTYREADLKVTGLTGPTVTPHSGDTIDVSFTVSNIGTRDTREGFWIDRVYLSQSPSLDDSSYMIGQSDHGGILAAGSSYNVTLSAQVPDGIQGSWYLVVFTDSNLIGAPDTPGVSQEFGVDPNMGRVEEFQGEGNNITAIPQQIILTPAPDLQVTVVNAPAHVLRGQSFDISYTVQNAGAGDTPARQSTWTDNVYLSRDQVLDPSDTYLATYTHTGGLAAGDTYTVDLTVTAPFNLTGPYYVFVITDPPTFANPRGDVFEGNNEDNNDTSSPLPVLFDTPPPADLEVDSVVAPASAKSGDPVEITWTVSNHSPNEADGSWTDTAYLSPTPVWNYTDPAIGSVQESGPIAGNGGSYTATLDATLPIALPGTYYVIVRNDVFFQVYSGTNTADKTTTSTNSFTVSTDALQLGVVLPTTLDSQQDRLYQIAVGQGQTLQVTLTSSDPTATNELYLRYGAVPDGTDYDAIYQGPLMANQTVTIPTTLAGTYYLLVRGDSEPAAATPVTLLAQLLPFQITDISPDQGGDAAYVTTTITGAQFDPQAIVKLVRPGIAEYEPVSYQVVNATKIVAIFDFTNAPHGLYDVEVINPNGDTAIIPYRYQVEQALPPDVTVGLGGPRVLFAGATAQYSVSLQSLTNVDIPYVDFQVGVPHMDDLTAPTADFAPHLNLITDLNGDDSASSVAWAAISPSLNTTGELQTPGYALDLADGSSDQVGFTVQTYPDGLPTEAGQNPADETAFTYHIEASAPPLTRDEFIAQETQYALTLRSSILADPTASTGLIQLAANATTWTNLYLAALTQAGLLRPVDEPPTVRADPNLVSLTATHSAGILLGPAGKQIVTTGDLNAFFNQVATWYGNNSTLVTPYLTTGYGGDTLKGAVPPASDYNLNESQPTHYEGFNVYVWYVNDYGDESHPENPDYVSVSQPDFTKLLLGPAGASAASMIGPVAQGSQAFIPLGQPLPYTIQFGNSPQASSNPGQIQIVTQLDPNLLTQSFRLGDLQIGDLEVHIPDTVGSFQGDFDFTQSKGFILRVSAGVDVNSGTVTWLIQAIDPSTGEVITDPTKGLLAAGATGFVSYTIQPKDGLATGTQISAKARILFNTAAPQDTNTVTDTVDGVAPTTTLTVTPVAGGNNFQVQWVSTDDSAGSGFKSVTLYVATDGGDYVIWQDQLTQASGSLVYQGQAGDTYQFLALATDNAGNREQPPSGISAPDDGSGANLGAVPTVPATSTDIAPPAPPPTTLSTNPLFTQAEVGVPAPALPASQPASEFTSVVQPFIAEAFATGIPQSFASIGPVAIVVKPDGTILASGGPARNQLYQFPTTGGTAATPLATVPYPVFDMKFDAQGNLWAATAGGPLLQLDPNTGAILAQYGNDLTQTLAIDPKSGDIYVSSGNGIEKFDPTTQTFSHFSNVRVGDLNFAPDGTLWGVSWPTSEGTVVTFDAKGHATTQLQFAAPVDSIAFGIANSPLDGLLFVSHDEAGPNETGTDLSMVDLATLQTVTIASGGTRGDVLTTTPDGRVLLSQSNQIDVISPIQPPRVAGTNPPPDALVALPLGSIAVTFDHDMLADDPTTDPASVLNPANYSLIGAASGAIAVQNVTYNAGSRTAVLTFNTLQADKYVFQVGTGVESADHLALATAYSLPFQAASDFSPLVQIAFARGQADAADGTISYDVTVTNQTGYDLLAPMELYFDGLVPTAAQLAQSHIDPLTGDWWIDLGSLLPGGRLGAGQSTTAHIVTIDTPSTQRLAFKAGLLAAPYANVDPAFTSTPVTTATVGQAYQYQAVAVDPNGSGLYYLLAGGPAGMTVNAQTGLISWTPTPGSPASAAVTLQAYNLRGGFIDQDFTIAVAGVNLPPVFAALAAVTNGQEGQQVQVSVSATDPQGAPLVYWADNLPPGASFDPIAAVLSWTPGFGQAGTYTNVSFTVSDGTNRVSESTTLLIAPSVPTPNLTRPLDRTVREGDPIRFQIVASDPAGNPLTYSSNFVPGGVNIDPITGLFTWTPDFNQHGVYAIPITVSNGTNSVTKTFTVTVLNVNAAPVFSDLGPFQDPEGNTLQFDAIAFDPNNPAFIPQARLVDGSLAPLEGTAPTLTYTVSGMPDGATFDAVTGLFTWTPDYSTSGTFTVAFTATNGGDGTGIPAATTQDVVITVLKVNRPPAVTPIGNQTLAEGATLDLSVQASDPDPEKLTLTVTGLPSFATFTDNGDGTGSFDFAPGVGTRGNYTINVTATDTGNGLGPLAVLSDTQSFVLSVTSLNEPPVLTAIGPKVAVVGQQLSFVVNASDLDQDALTFGLSGLPAAAVLTPGNVYGTATLTWTPTAADVGSYSAVVTVTDNGNNGATTPASDSKTVAIVVRTTNQAPTLAPIGTLNTAEGATFSYTLSAVDPDNDPLTYTATNLPPGATLDPVSGVFSWSPGLFTAGSYPNIVFTASDGNLSASQTATVIVEHTSHAPVFIPMAPENGQEASAIQFTLAVTDIDNDPLTYQALTPLPAGASFDTTTGRFSWTPAYGQAGAYSLQFQVTNPAGQSDQTSVAINVAKTERPPVIAVSSHFVLIGNTLAFAVNGTDPDPTDVLTFSAAGLPPGATLDPNTGKFSWTPGPTQAGDYPVNFVVADAVTSASTTVILRAGQTATPPNVVLELTPSFPALPSQKVLIHAAASGLADIVGLTVSVNGQSLTLDSQGRATYTPTQPGQYVVTATATDADGLVGTTTTVLKVRDPNANGPPAVAFSPELDGSKLTTATNVIATVNDNNLDTWTLSIAHLDSNTYTTLATGTTPFTDAAAFDLDPGLFPNGFYRLRLTATNISGLSSTVYASVEVDTSVKPGQYLNTVTDLTTDLGGVSVSIVRQYDSLEAGQMDTFGYGWRFVNRDSDIETNVPLTGREYLGVYNPFRVGTRLYLNLPDGSRVGFTFTPVEHDEPGVTYYTPAWTADPGVSYTLQSVNDLLTLAGQRLYDLKTGVPYNPASDDLAGPEYTLTAPDGTIYYLSTARGVEEEVTPGGVQLVYSDSGITNLQTGDLLSFVNGAQGQIASISAADGTTVLYGYDVAGHLLSARNIATGAAARYGYTEGATPLLSMVADPTGAGGVAVNYGPTGQALPVAAYLGTINHFEGTAQSGNLAAGGTDRYLFIVQPSELQSTPQGTIYFGVSVQAAAGSSFQPGVPALVGLTPVFTQTTANGSYAIFAVSTSGLQRLEIAGANAATSGAYTLQLFVLGDVNGDGNVDGIDAQLLAAAQGTSVGQPGYLLGADLNRDGKIDGTDSLLFAANYGFVAGLPPTVTATTATTHQDLAVSVPLTALATDPQDYPVYFHVVGATNGTAQLSPDGQSIVFTPDAGYTGPASFQFQADDGYGTSAPATVMVNVSTAPLVGLDFVSRAPELDPGDTQTMAVTGDFADQSGVALPASYVSFQTLDPTVAVVTATGQLTAVAPGSTALIVSSHGLQAATVVDVDAPNAFVPPDYTGLQVSPPALTLADSGGTQQLTVLLSNSDETAYLTPGSTGTRYFTSNPSVVAVSADGLVSAVGDGTATVTVIADGQEAVIPVQAIAVHVGPQTVGASGCLVQGTDDAQVEIAPGALSSGITVQIMPVSLASLPEGPPNGFQFIGAEQLGLGGQSLALLAELAIPVPAGTPVGTEVYVYLATTLPDETGTAVPVWQEVDVGFVGADGFARTGLPPYQGILSEGTYAFAIANDPTQVTQVQVTLDPSSFAGALGARYALVDPFGFDPVVSILSEGAFALSSFTFTLDMKFGPDPVQIEAIPLAGPPSITTIQLTVEPGSNDFTEAITPLAANDIPPDIESVALNLNPNQAPALILTGDNFGSDVGNLQVIFQMVGEPAPVLGTNLQLNGNQLTVTVPQTVTLGDCGISVQRTVMDSAGNALATLDSDPTPVFATGGYLFTALPGDGQVAVIDTRATILQGMTTVPNPNLNQLVARIPLAGGTFPQYVAVTADNNRAYVTDPANHGVAVIDAIALQQINADPTKPGTNEIRRLPLGAAPNEIAIDPEDNYAYVTDEASHNEGSPNGTSVVYVIDIDPTSPTYNQLVRTITIPNAPFGLNGLAVNSDDTQLFVAVPNMLPSENAPQVLPNGRIQVIDLTPDLDGNPAWKLLNSIDPGNDPFGVTAGPNDVITFTDYLGNSQSLGLIAAGSTTATFTAFNFQGNINDEFEVNNARGRRHARRQICLCRWL